MNRIGILYTTGTGESQDFVAALAWYQRAAAHGSGNAMNNIATLHLHGLGVPQSNEEAVKWLRLAVKQGDAAAQNKLGSMYDAGLDVPKNAHDAFALYSLTAAQLGALSQRLDAKQIEQAQADARKLLDAQSKPVSAVRVNASNSYRF